MVRLITHNLLACHAKGCTSNNFPLKFQNVRLEVRETEMNVDFLKRFMPKLEWSALVETARELGDASLPAQPPEVGEESNTELYDAFFPALHHVLLEIHIEEGSMVCPNCQHVYPIANGIPNMVCIDLARFVLS